MTTQANAASAKSASTAPARGPTPAADASDDDQRHHHGDVAAGDRQHVDRCRPPASGRAGPADRPLSSPMSTAVTTAAGVWPSHARPCAATASRITPARPRRRARQPAAIGPDLHQQAALHRARAPTRRAAPAPPRRRARRHSDTARGRRNATGASSSAPACQRSRSASRTVPATVTAAPPATGRHDPPARIATTRVRSMTTIVAADGVLEEQQARWQRHDAARLVQAAEREAAELLVQRGAQRRTFRRLDGLLRQHGAGQARR